MNIKDDVLTTLKRQILDLETKISRKDVPTVNMLKSTASTTDIVNKINELILILNNKLR